MLYRIQLQTASRSVPDVQNMSARNKKITMIKFLGFMSLVGQFFCKVKGDDHFYDFVVSILFLLSTPSPSLIQVVSHIAFILPA